MVEVVAVVVGLVSATAMVRAGARRLGVPDPVALLVVGTAVSWIPGLPPVRIDPDFVLVVLLPMLLYCAAFSASVPAIRRNLLPIVLLSVGLTIVSALAVGAVAALLVPGMGFGAACALGAVVAPPDAVAATSVARTVRMPRRVVALLEGESLFNDAAALSVLTVAVGAVTSGSVTFAAASGRFLLISLGGLIVGAVAAVVIARVRARVRNPYTDVVVFLVAPFVAYLPADLVGASGLVAVVVAGLYLGHRATAIMEPGARVVTGSVQTAVSWLLEGVVFLLVGLQLRSLLAGIAANPPGLVAAVAGAVVVTLLVVRAAWVLLGEQVVSRLRRRRRATWAESVLTTWASMRGAVSLAAVLTVPVALPDGQGFPQRDLLVFVTFVVILVTLLGQGLTLSPLARRLQGARRELAEDARDEAQARGEAADAAMECLERIQREEPGRDEVAEQLRRRIANRQLGAAERLAALDAGETAADADARAHLEPVSLTASGPDEPARDTYRRYGQAILTAERNRLLELRNTNRLSEAAFVRIQRELDLEQAALLVR